MKLTTLLEQCESDNTAASLLAKQRLRYHAAEVLPELVVLAREFQCSVLNYGAASEGLIYRLQNAIAAAEEVKDHSEQLTPVTKPQNVGWDFNDQETFQP